MSDIIIVMGMSRYLKTAEEKIEFAKLNNSIVDEEFDEALNFLHRGFKYIFNTVLPHELEFDEILALGYNQLQKVYDDFGKDMEKLDEG